MRVHVMLNPTRTPRRASCGRDIVDAMGKYNEAGEGGGCQATGSTDSKGRDPGLKRERTVPTGLAEAKDLSRLCD